MLGAKINFQGSDGSTANYFNDRSTNVPDVSPFYYLKLETVDGLYGADIAYESHSIPNDIGEKSGDVNRKGKTITLAGIIWAKDYKTLEAGADALGQVFADLGSRKMIWT